MSLLRVAAGAAVGIVGACLLASCGGGGDGGSRDTEAPVAELTAPEPRASNITGMMPVALIASDNVGVAAVDVQIDGETIVTLGPGTLQTQIDTNLFASGQHVVRVRARDAAGNASAWSSAQVHFGGTRAQSQGFARDSNWITGLSNATAFAQAPDGRWFVAQQGGQLRVVKDGQLLPTPFIALNVDPQGERGLLGVAFHPEFGTNPAKRYVYLYYTVPGNPAHNRISRFTPNTVNPDIVSIGSESVLADLPNLSNATNHNGGALHFGPDGKLYVAVGDNANGAKAPDQNDPFGKILRFNDDGSIPDDNPFCTLPQLRCAVWAKGLRNPYTFAFRPSDGRMHINDVGEQAWEEINRGVAGADYGWPDHEGASAGAGQTLPLYAYRHEGVSGGDFLTGCAITGAAFYGGNGPFPPAYRDNYFFADFCGQYVARMDAANGNAVYTFGAVEQRPVDVAVGLDGALYVLTRTGITRFAAQ